MLDSIQRKHLSETKHLFISSNKKSLSSIFISFLCTIHFCIKTISFTLCLSVLHTHSVPMYNTFLYQNHIIYSLLYQYYIYIPFYNTFLYQIISFTLCFISTISFLCTIHHVCMIMHCINFEKK